MFDVGSVATACPPVYETLHFLSAPRERKASLTCKSMIAHTLSSIAHLK